MDIISKLVNDRTSFNKAIKVLSRTLKPIQENRTMANTRREKEKKKMRYSNAKEVADKQSRGFELTTLNLPKGMSLLTFKEAGMVKLDCLPYVCKAGNPMADEGMVHYERTYYVHKGINPSDDKASYCCPQKCFGKPCPVCEYVGTIRNQPDTDQDLVKSLNSKKRQIFAVIDKAHRDKGIQIHEGSYYNGLGELIDNKIDASDEDSPYRTFHHLDSGMSLHISVKPNPPYGNSAENLEMVARKPITGGLSDDGESVMVGDMEVPCLDSLLKEVSYDFLQDLIQGKAESVDNDGDDSEVDESDSTDEPVVKKKKKSPLPDDDEDEGDSDLESEHEEDGYEVGDMVMYKKFGLCEVVKVNPKTGNLRLEDDNGDLHENVLPSEVSLPKKGKVKMEEDEDTDTDEPEEGDDSPLEEDDEPTPKKRGRKPKVEEDNDEDEDMEEDDEPEEPSDLESDDEDDDEPVVKKKLGRKKAPIDEDEDD